MCTFPLMRHMGRIHEEDIRQYILGSRKIILCGSSWKLDPWGRFRHCIMVCYLTCIRNPSPHRYRCASSGWNMIGQSLHCCENLFFVWYGADNTLRSSVQSLVGDVFGYGAHHMIGGIDKAYAISHDIPCRKNEETIPSMR